MYPAGAMAVGEYYGLIRHAALAGAASLPHRNIFLPSPQLIVFRRRRLLGRWNGVFHAA